MNVEDESQHDEFGDCDYLSMIDESVFCMNATSTACTSDEGNVDTPQVHVSRDNSVSNSLASASIDCDSLTSSAKRQKTIFSAETTKAEISPILENELENIVFDARVHDTDTSSVGTQELHTRLLQTLEMFFGYTQFRKQQLEVMVQLIFYRRDAAIFWATGQGKSLCYQIPALLEAHPFPPSNVRPIQGRTSVVIVISPLISLMQDQVYKLNSLLKSDSSRSSQSSLLATYLGSTDDVPDAEDQFDAILNGRYKLIYMTPEKLLNGSTVPFLIKLHTSKYPIALFAVDEAHCVSEWGFDFRREFRGIGPELRSCPALKDVPILALTATAVPQVRQDICESLLLRNPYVSKQSFDRSNLRLRVYRKSSGGNALAAAMEPIISDLMQRMRSDSDERGSRPPHSTIIYASTRAQVDEITSFLRLSVLAGASVSSSCSKASMVEAYHAGMTAADRNRAHTLFLTGQISVIVATTAFGMGIDKPDIRRVIHFGCPKTIEEYYQQVGRAGRDGYVAECTMYVSESDFDKYKGDFYLGGLTGTALEATKASMAALRSYSFNHEICRRKALLDYFQDDSSFGDRCGTCDNCQYFVQYGTDMYRDFSDLGALVVLTAVGALKEQGMTTILQIISGNVVDDYRYKSGMTSQHVKNMIQTYKEKLKKKYSQGYYRDMISSLVGKGYLEELTRKTRVNGYERVWTTYQLSKLGEKALQQSLPILLPVSESLRQIERREEQKREEMLLELQSHGIDLDRVPSHEIEQGGGEVVNAYMKWKKFVSSLQNSGRMDRLNDANKLIQLIESWRSDAAVKFRVAPASVLAEHSIFQIAYTLATMPPGLKLEAKTLESIGVRSRDLHTLIKSLDSWVDVAQPKVTDLCNGADREDSRMVLSEVLPKFSWPFVVSNKKSSAMAWEQYYARFNEGESPQSIAANPGGRSGSRPIQVSTVVSHILDALVRGKKVDLRRLEQYLAVPTRKEWEHLQQAEISTGMDVTGDPNQSGVDGGKFLMKDLLRPIVGSAIADASPSERSDNDQNLYAKWCDKLRIYSSFRRIGYEPTFQPSGIFTETSM